MAPTAALACALAAAVVEGVYTRIPPTQPVWCTETFLRHEDPPLSAGAPFCVPMSQKRTGIWVLDLYHM